MPAEVVGVIPARFGSTRLPGKALAEIEGVPMIVRVWRQTRRRRSLGRVIVATDDERIARAVRAAGGEAMMTSPDASERHRSDRGSRGAESTPTFISTCRAICRLSHPADLDALAAPMRADAAIRDGDAGDADRRRRRVVQSERGESGVRRARRRALFLAQPDSVSRATAGVPGEALRHIGVYALSARLPAALRARLQPGVLETDREARTTARARARLSYPGGGFGGAVA